MALTQNELSILDLVASDVSYRPASAFAGDAIKAPLFSYQDSAPEKEFGFPDGLLTGLSNTVNSPTAFILSQDINGVNTVSFTNWEFVRKFQDDENGFGAIVYRSKVQIEGKTHYIVAMQGSDGPSARDWFQNLYLAREAWGKEKDEVTNFLTQGSLDFPGIVPSDGIIHFTGQSLGGGLAQYAAYAYVKEMNTLAEADPSKKLNLETDVSLVTFNGFGAVKGLMDLEGSAFKADLLNGATTYHYAINNDIVHRLGRSGADAPGGSWHLNGQGHSVEFDFRRVIGGQEVAGTQNFLNLVDAHRIESGFYQGFANYSEILGTSVNFETALQATVGGRLLLTVKGFDYVDTGVTQGIGARFAHLFTRGGDSSEKGSLARLGAGLLSGIAVGPLQEVQKVNDALFQALLNSGDINEATRVASKALPTAAKIAVFTFLRVLGAATPAGFLITLGATIWKAVTGVSETETVAQFNRELPDNQKIQVQQVSVAGDTQADRSE